MIHSGTALSINHDGTIIVGIVGSVVDRKSVCWMYDGPTSPPIIKYMDFRRGTMVIVEAVNFNGSISHNYFYAAGTLSTGLYEEQRAFRWTHDKLNRRTYLIALNLLDNYDQSTAYDLDGNGNIIVGSCHQVGGGVDACYWDNSSGVLRIIKLNSPQGAIVDATRNCQAQSTNINGTIIAGSCHLTNNYKKAVCWIGDTREAIILPCLEENCNSAALGVSNDGNVIVGSCRKEGEHQRAVLWRKNPSTNEFNIEDLNFPEPEGPTRDSLAAATGVSQDGTVIVGTRMDDLIEPDEGSDSYSFIWKDGENPTVQELERVEEEYKYCQVHDVIKKQDGNTIAVGRSALCHGDFIAVCWNNLEVENLHFPT